MAWLSLALVLGFPSLASTETPPVTDKPPVDYHSDVPPRSTYDRNREQQTGGTSSEETRSVTYQLVRTVLSLFFVVALLYLVYKLFLAKMGRFKSIGGPELRIVTRVQVDTKHAIAIVEVAPGDRFLVGLGGANGVTMLAPLLGAMVDTTTPQRTSSTTFSKAMRRADPHSGVAPSVQETVEHAGESKLGSA